MRHLRYLSIRAKIVLLPAIMLCALIAYCLFTVVQSRLSIAALDRFGSEQLPVVSEVNLASLGLVEVHALFTAAVGDRSEFLLDDALRHAALTRSRIEQMSGGAVANTRIGELLELWDRFVERSGTAVQHVITGDADLRTLHLLATDKQQAYDAVREAFVALRADTEAGFAAALNDAARRTNQSLELGIAIVAALCALTVLMAMLVHASIGEPIERLKTAVGEVARGNFGGRAEVEGSDAIAEMCAAFNALLADLQAAVGETNRVLAALAQGNFRPRIAADLPGELGRLKDGVNTCADSLQHMMEALADREAGLEAARAELERRVEERTQSLRHEVTERRQAEEALRVERSALKSLLENIRAVPWEMDPGSGACRYVGPQVERLWGWPADAFAAPGFLLSCLREDDRAAFAAALARLPHAREVEIEFRLRRRSGEEVHVRSLLSHGIESGGRRATIHGISIDVTEQRRLEAKLQQAQKLESVGRLAAGVAHEINTPVQYVNDNCHFVRDALSDLNALLQRYRETLETLAPSSGDAQAALEAMRASEEEMDAAYLLENMLPAMERSIEGLERVAVIVRSMKEFAHPDQKQIVQADLNRAIESTLTIARNEYKYVADVKTELGQLPPVPCFLGDLNQAILNIVVNAAHAIAEVARESGRRGLITVRTEAHADCVSIRISDTGCGMPEHVRARIFDPFFTTKEVGKGTGQGLAIVHSVIVDRHGGSIDVDSEPGKGSTFTIRLPVAAAHAMEPVT